MQPSIISNWLIPHIISYLSDTDLPPLRHINHFWNQCIIESLLFPPITYTSITSSHSNTHFKTKCKPHQHRPSKILIVGDGNFSFTLSLCTLLPPLHSCSICKIPLQSRIIITSTLSKDIKTLSENHPSSIHNIQKIKNTYPFCKIYFGVDATNLQQTLFNNTKNKLLFDQIIWNFPHSNNHRHIATNRNLLKNFFKSAATFLDSNGIITVRLCFGQGGTIMENKMLQCIIKNHESKSVPLSLIVDKQYKNSKSVRLKYEFSENQKTENIIKKTKVIKLRDYNNSWKIVEMASYSDFILCDIKPFYWNVFSVLYYAQTGRRGNDKRFLMDLSLTHNFMRDNHSMNDGGMVVVNKLYSMVYFRDISFWLS
eukprot:378800_1